MDGIDKSGSYRSGAAGSELLQKITGFMIKHQIAGLPRNFELVHEAYSGSNPDLTHDLAALGSHPSQLALDQLGLKHRLPGHCGLTAERLQADALKALSRIKEQLALGLTQKHSFSRSVETVARSLSDDVTGGINQILGELEMLAAIAKEMVTAETQLAAQVAEGLQTLESADRAVRAAKGMMMRDRLTGLPNRSAFFEKLDLAHAASSHAHASALVLIEIGDLAGLQHQYGDEATFKLVKGLAGIFRKAIKKHDQIFKLEADSFAFLFDGVDADEAHIIAERLFTTAENNLVFASEAGPTFGGLPLAIGHAMSHEGSDPLNWLALAKAAAARARINPRQPIIGYRAPNRNVA